MDDTARQIKDILLELNEMQKLGIAKPKRVKKAAELLKRADVVDDVKWMRVSEAADMLLELAAI